MATKKRSLPPPRKPRADAQRNRALLIDVAKDAFSRSGANVSLDEIARQAGVGIGTLYRHFPTREALLETVYSTEMEKLAAAEREFSRDMPPVEALRAWMLLFVDYIAAKQIILPAIYALLGKSPKVFESSGDLLRNTIDALVQRAVENGDIRTDIEPYDLLRALYGLSIAAAGPVWVKSAKQLVDILILGSRPAK